MELIADILLMAGAVGAACYCAILAARLRRLQTLESGMGGAIAVLSAQVDDMNRALERARGASRSQAEALESLATRGEAAARKLELLMASLHDLPETPRPVAAGPRGARFVRRRAQRETVEDDRADRKDLAEQRSTVGADE